MSGHGWKPSKSAARASTNNRSSEIARVILFSILLAVLFQFPMSAVHRSQVERFSHSVQPEAGEPESAYSSAIVEQSRAVRQRAFQPTSIPHYAFIKFSSYRVSLKTFHVVGISSQVVRDWDRQKVVHTCEWHSASNGSQVNSSATVANASMLYIPFDENGMTYVPAIVNCTFGDDVGADGHGGQLVIRVSLTYHRWEKNVPSVVLDEHSGDIALFLKPPKEKPHKYAFCGPPMHGHVNADWIKAWLLYHNHIWKGNALFFFYNVGGLRDDERHHLKEFVEAGILHITDLESTQIQSLYPAWYYHQILFINDCFQRAQFLADYVFFFDLDEFLQIRPPLTLDGLLDEHEHLPWISVGNVPADIAHCAAPDPSPTGDQQQQQYAVERMLWHDSQPECQSFDEDPWVCFAQTGRRKWIANTKFAILGGVHRAAQPAEGGLQVNGSEARVIHFHGVLDPSNHVCRHLEADSNLGHMERDETIKLALAQAKLLPLKRTVTAAARYR